MRRELFSLSATDDFQGFDVLDDVGLVLVLKGCG